MNFIVENEIFEKIPDVCFGVVVARGIDNSKEYSQIEQFLNENIVMAENRFADKKVKRRTGCYAIQESIQKIGH